MAQITFTFMFVNAPDISREARHVYLDTPAPHDCDGCRCWCAPRIQALCSSCDGEGCWNCEDGWRAVEAAEAEAIDAPCIIIHND